MIKSFKFKLRPNKTQENIFYEWLDTCRLIYNLTIEQKKYAWDTHQVSISKYESYNQLPELKSEFTWIKNVHSDVLQQTIDRVFKAYDGFFKKGGYPKFKKKGFYNSFTFKRSISIKNNYIKLPKIGDVKFFNSRHINGNLKTATISKELDGWYISITADVPVTITPSNNQAVGIDVGLKHFLTLSNETFIDSPYFIEPKLKELKILQRKLSRQKKGSNSRNKTKYKIQKLYLKLTRSRTDFLHKTSTAITNLFDEVYVEDLNIQKMLKTDSKLSRKMLDNSFYTFRLMLQYKAKIFKAVNPAYTSQTCSKCGHVCKDNRKSQAIFDCQSCGHFENADVNAAKNILAMGKSFSTKAKPLG